MTRSKDWAARLADKIAGLAPPSAVEYRKANAAGVTRAVRGFGPHAAKADPGAGARVVLNLASAHVPAFCQDGYRNGYELGRIRVGWFGNLPRRELVDRALPLPSRPPGKTPAYKRVYFAAAELNGAGIRYYGDLSLVLKPQEVDAGTIVLERNSYDLLLPPISDRIAAAPIRPENARAKEAAEMAGTWGSSFPDMAAIKVLASGGDERLLTMGQISSGLLADEDYLEVLHHKRVTTSSLVEVRTDIADTALETGFEEQLRRRKPLRMEDLIWLQQRRAAANALGDSRVRLRTVTSAGRQR